MVFSSLLFIFLYLPLCLGAYYAFGSRAVRNVILTSFSLLFYAWGEPIWVGLLIFSGFVDYLNGLFIERHRGTGLEKLGLYSTLVVNLGLLATFKYSDFIVENVNALTGLSFDKPGFLLPIGISFYTFQTISYTIDVYRGEVRAQRSFLNFLLFVSSFHQLVAGPIVRYSHVAREIEERVFSLRDFSTGVTRFCQGLFKKVFIANVAGELAVQFLDKPVDEFTFAGNWFGLLAFSLQIYFDFSGYSDMAIGLGRMFGFHYHENFRHPYVSNSVTDFWRRWHISLGSFFRDYVYIPLGGNRRHATRNLFLVWGLTGLWHGASWNFVLWGLYFGVLLWLEKGSLKRWLDAAPAVLRHAYALVFIMLGWAIFYFTDLGRLQQFLAVLLRPGLAPLCSYEVVAAWTGHLFWLALALVMCTPLLLGLRQRIEPLLPVRTVGSLVVLGNTALLLLSVTLLVGKAYNPFIYFRF